MRSLLLIISSGLLLQLALAGPCVLDPAESPPPEPANTSPPEPPPPSTTGAPEPPPPTTTGSPEPPPPATTGAPEPPPASPAPDSSSPPTVLPNPYYKVIFDKGHVLTTAAADHNKQVEVEFVNEFFSFRFAHKPHWPHDDYMIITRNDQQWSELSFVIENKPGHDCEVTSEPLRSLIYRCVGDMMFRDLNEAEKAKIAKSKEVLATITDPETKLAYRITYLEAKLMMEQSGEMKQLKVEDNYEPGSSKMHAVVAPGKEAYVILHASQPFAKEKFVVESTANPKTECTTTTMGYLLCYCSGNLKLRELTSDEKASFAL